jgi:glycosyltransferase involved in cell wall biosynthesis
LSGDADVIHAHWTLSALCAQPASKLRGKPLLATVQGSDLLEASYGFIGSGMAALALRKCANVTALSLSLASRAKELGVPAERVQIIPNGVDVSWFTPPDEDPKDVVVTYVGSLIPRKGVNFLLGAIPSIVEARSDTQFLIVGDGPQRGELEQLTTDLHVGGSVRFLGAQPPTMIRSLLRKSTLLVLPSKQEGFGVVLIEAMACGVPVVASNVDGIQDVVTSSAGILVEPGSSPALSSAIVDLLGNGARRVLMGAAGRQRAVQEYSWDIVGERYVSLYTSLLAKSPFPSI